MPIERRLQTLAVLYYSSSFLFIGSLSVFTLIFLLFTRYYFISFLYILWLIYDRNVCNQGGRINYWVREWTLWKHFADYFPLKLIKTTDLDPNKNYIFGCHPHGILCFSYFGNFATEGTQFSRVFPDITPHLLTLEGQFWFPINRELFIMSGKGHALVLMVGGAIEALDAVPNTLRLTLNKRKGFIKLALRNGASLVPVISFGENELLIQKENEEKSLIRKIQTFMTESLGFSPPMFH
ncbi:unnamed protein product, partial [Medioppia subpectinata]